MLKDMYNQCNFEIDCGTDQVWQLFNQGVAFSQVTNTVLSVCSTVTAALFDVMITMIATIIIHP